MEVQLENGHSRRLSDVENYFASFQRQKLYKNFTVIGQFNKELILDRKPLVKALRSLFLKHPILVATIVNTDYSDLNVVKPLHDYIKIIDLLRFDDLVLDLTEDVVGMSLVEKCSYLNNVLIPLVDESPLWKLGILDDCTVAYISNHVLADGTSGKNFLQDLTAELNNGKFEDDDDIETNPVLFDYSKDHEQLPQLPPSLDSTIELSAPLTYLLKVFLHKFTLTRFCFQHSSPTTKDDKHIYKTLKISSNDLSNLKKALKENSLEKPITLTPYVQIAWLKTLHDNFKPLHQTYFKSIDFLIPCNARQYIPSTKPSKLDPSKEEEINHDAYKYGWHTGGLQSIHSSVPKMTWNLINQQNSYLKRSFESKSFLNAVGMLKWDWMFKNKNRDKFCIDRTFASRRGGTCFSNLGMLNTGSDASTESNGSSSTITVNEQEPQKDEFRIVDAIFTQNLGVTAYSFGIYALSTVEGGLNFVFTTTEDLQNEQEFDALISEFEKNLLSYDSIE